MRTEVKILLIDDVPANILSLEQLLDREGRTFLKASNGQDGLRAALHNDIDLIILDVQMPGLNGFEVAQVLKSGNRTKEIPIIFTSAEVKEREGILQGFEEGAVDFLLKPLDPELTKAKVSGLLTIQLQRRAVNEKNIALEHADRQIKELNIALAQKLEQVERANKELESFSYSVSHDLRAPLRALIGFSEMLGEELPNENERHRQLAARIQKNATRMNGMIDDLLAFSKIGQTTMKKKMVNMTSLVESVLDDLKINQPHHAHIDLQDLYPAMGDETLLNHVWTNLLSNAVKYSSKKETPVVEISSTASADEVTYHVKDNGAGFSMEHAARLFGVFQRFHKPGDFEGTGIGLAIVQRIIDKHGGRIWADAAVNTGATFHFTLSKG